MDLNDYLEDVRGLVLEEIERLRSLGSVLGAAFQIKDDLLNLQADERECGKQIGGERWEGKHTLMLIHFMRSAPPEDATPVLGSHPMQEGTLPEWTSSFRVAS